MSLSRDIKVGLFVFAGIVFFSVAVFLIGDERRLFSASVSYSTSFSDVQGLKPGAPIRMGGIDIGSVESVGYDPSKPADGTIHVELDIVKSEAGRIKTDSVAKVVAKGLLGDKMIEISKGSDQAPPLPPGGTIKGVEPDDLFKRAEGMADTAEATMENLHRVSETLADAEFQKDLQAAVSSLSTILGAVAEGDGYPNRFLTSRDEAERISRAVTSFDQAGSELARTLEGTRGIVRRVEAGPGFAHDVIYGGGPQKQVEQFGDAAAEVALTLRGVREGSGVMRDVLYGGEDGGGEAVANLVAITSDLRAIVSDVRAGKGTVGGLLVDPSIYEDLKGVLGNVERNDVMRALVRYSIKQEGRKPPPKVEPPKR